MSERDELLFLMRKHRLRFSDVASILNVTEQCVRVWCCKSPDRNIPQHKLRLLKYELTAKHELGEVVPC